MKAMTTIAALLTLTTAALAASNTVTVTDPSRYAATDWLTDISPGGFDASAEAFYVWAGAAEGVRVWDRVADTTVSYAPPADYFTPPGQLGDGETNPYSSFVRLDPSGTSLWAGFTTAGNADDRIYQLDLGTGVWTYRATLAGNADLEFAPAGALVSGLNSTDWSTPNSIWLLDTTGENAHDKLAEVGGYANGLATDAEGDVYYATTDARLIRFDAGDLAGAIGASALTAADATLLSDLPGGGYDVAADNAGNILATCNGGGSWVVRWLGLAGAGDNVETLSTGAGSWGNWHGPVAAFGDVTDYQLGGGSVLLTDFYEPGVTEIATVPAPAAIVLLLAGGGALLRKRSH